MAHLIDKDALVAEIWKRRNKHFNFGGSPSSEYCHEDDEILGIINTFEVKEVDLDKEFSLWWKGERTKDYNVDILYERHSTVSIKLAKHFFELGLSVSNSAKVTTPDIEDVLKENGVNPDSKEAKIIKESYYMALERLKAQKGE